MTWIGGNVRPALPRKWSPSSINRLIDCEYQFAVWSDIELRARFVRPNTYSSLGSAIHKLTERVWSNEIAGVPDNQLEHAINQLWEQCIKEQSESLARAWGDSRVPPPVDWPYYSLSARRTLRRTLEEVRQFRAGTWPKVDEGRTLVEEEIVDASRNLAGIPDRVVFSEEGFSVIDLKTGHSIDGISERYRRQLLIYAHLVAQKTDSHPWRIGILNAGGELFWESVSQEEISNCIDEVDRAIANYEAKLNSTEPVFEAEPSPEKCRFCSFKAMCSEYWTSTDPAWMEYRGIVGIVRRVTGQEALTVEQLFPASGAGSMIGISGARHQAIINDVVVVVDARREGNSIVCRWDSRVEVIGNDLTVDEIAAMFE